MGYSLNAAERGYNIGWYEGCLSFGTGLSGLPYSIRHWELSKKEGESRYAFGHKVIAAFEAIPVLGGLMALIERLVAFVCDKIFCVNNFPVSTSIPKVVPPKIDKNKPLHTVKPLLPIDIPSYEALSKKLELGKIEEAEKEARREARAVARERGATKEEAIDQAEKIILPRPLLFVIDEAGKHQETLSKVLGCGGSKKAIQISEGRVLILPNMDADSVNVVAERWERMVLEETKMSEILSKRGLLSSSPKQVFVANDEFSEHVIPAYICESFENLEKKGWYILDSKNLNSSTWKTTKSHLFNSDEERLEASNWDSVTDELLTDVAKICFYDLPADGDALNLAIVKKPSETAISQYEIRYFGFDFSSKHSWMDISETTSKCLIMKDIEWYLHKILDDIFFLEFGSRYDRGEESQKLKEFRTKLEEKYKIVVADRMNRLITSAKKEEQREEDSLQNVKNSLAEKV